MRKLEIAVRAQFYFLGFSAADFKSVIVQPESYRKHFYEQILSYIMNPMHYSAAISSVEERKDPLRAAIDKQMAPSFAELSELFTNWTKYLEMVEEIGSKINVAKMRLQELGLAQSSILDTLKNEKGT
jgi:hypothetical protein